MLVLKTASPKVSPRAPKPRPVKTVPSSRASFATHSAILSSCQLSVVRLSLSGAKIKTVTCQRKEAQIQTSLARCGEVGQLLSKTGGDRWHRQVSFHPAEA